MGSLTPKPADSIDYTNPPFHLTAIDRELLSMKDEDFHLITWEDLKSIIATNQLEELKRPPSHLRAYLNWCNSIKQTHSTLTNFVIHERLFWTPIPGTSNPPRFHTHSSVPFADERDFAVLVNDWPYGFTPDITHLLVWSKVPIPIHPDSGDVTEASRACIEAFVQRFFVRALERELDVGVEGPAREPSERVVWFKNWVGLQSVRGVEHVHVLVRGCSEGLLNRWTDRRDC